jgi:hypothetical protein
MLPVPSNISNLDFEKYTILGKCEFSLATLLAKPKMIYKDNLVDNQGN